MFDGADKKLERASVLLNDLKRLANSAGGFAYIPRENSQRMRAYLDAFFFELVSAKDFFLQGINEKYAGLDRDKGTIIKKLKREIKDEQALTVVQSIENKLSKRNTWQWILNNYRNSATHRELLHLGQVVTLPELGKELSDKLAGHKIRLKPIFEGEEKTTSSNVRRIDIPLGNIKTYLFKDPEDPSQGNLDIEVIPYLEQALENMKTWLEGLYDTL